MQNSQYDIVMITRNRQAMLELSVPMMLSQNLLPANFIIVDASDNHEEVKKTLELLFQKAAGSVRFEVIKSEAGTARQRSVGLLSVRPQVVFFPDDDALWFDNYANEIMSVYAMDNKDEIGAVTGTATRTPPPGVLSRRDAYRRLEFRDLLALYIDSAIDKCVDRFLPDPLYLEGKIRIRNKEIPVWLKNSKEAKISNLMTGFLMSFETEMIKRKAFDENLGRYALNEDRDASLSVLNTHLIVRAVNAQVFHYRVPEKRTAGFKWGFIHIAVPMFCVNIHKEMLCQGSI